MPIHFAIFSIEKCAIEWWWFHFDFIPNLCSLMIVEAKPYVSKNEFPYAEGTN